MLWNLIARWLRHLGEAPEGLWDFLFLLMCFQHVYTSLYCAPEGARSAWWNAIWCPHWMHSMSFYFGLILPWLWNAWDWHIKCVGEGAVLVNLLVCIQPELPSSLPHNPGGHEQRIGIVVLVRLILKVSMSLVIFFLNLLNAKVSNHIQCSSHYWHMFLDQAIWSEIPISMRI